MSDYFLGEVKLVSFNFAPKGFALCAGGMLKIADNQALYALLGTNYGGDGRTVFALPDLQGRTPVAQGQGLGLQNRSWGEWGGMQQVTVDLRQLPEHGHTLNAYHDAGDSLSPENASLAAGGAGTFTGQVPAGISVSGTTTIQGKSGALQNGQTSEARSVSGTVAIWPYRTNHPMDTVMSPSAIGSTGGGQPLNTESPYLAMLYVMALTGTFPARN